MPTSPQAEVTGAYNLVFRYAINGYQVQIPGVVPMTSDGVEAVGTNAQQMQGNVAHDAVDTGFPVKIGGYAAGVAAPAQVAVGDRVNAWFSQNGAFVISGANAVASSTTSSSMTTIAGIDGGARPLWTTSTVFDGTNMIPAPGDSVGASMVLAPRATAGGVTQYRRLATADTNTAVIKASAGRVYGFSIANNTASAKFVKLYNKASAPTLASDVPLRTIMVPANGMAAYHIGQGLAGFSAGIAIAATGGIADTDTTALAANDLIIQVDYA